MLSTKSNVSSEDRLPEMKGLEPTVLIINYNDSTLSMMRHTHRRMGSFCQGGR